MASNELFNQINQVWTNSKHITTKTKPESTYMTLRFISLHPVGILPASDLNRLQSVPEWIVLPTLKYATPKFKNAPRNKYPKKLVTEKKLTQKRANALYRVCKKFNLTTFHGLQVMTLLEEQGFKLETN